ncbi:hypothetical protein EBS67_15080, partial [bacterium]|nr:hypothetical protein [bacterium]
RKQLAASKLQGQQAIQLIYRAILIRSAKEGELAEIAAIMKASPTPEHDLIWALLNSPEFLFNQ